jgi:phosphoserine aminotransferase
MARIHNFNAGPAALPLPVLEKVQRELTDFEGTGMSILEHSHRGKAYEAVHNEAIALLRELAGIGDTHDVLLLQGGASLQFAMVPMNFVPPGQSADYVLTGSWSKKALSEAKRIGRTRVAVTSEKDGAFTRVPRQDEIHVDPDAAYLHYTTNNTIFGTQFYYQPDGGKVPLVADMSSDILSRPIDVARHAIIYAGAQKNIGPSGLAVVIIDKKFLASARDDIPTILRYATHAESNSLYNTANTFAVYVMREVLRHLKELGGLTAMQTQTREKAALLYGVIDEASDFFRCPVEVESRSQMNVVFRLPSEELDNKLLDAASAAGMAGLKGHRSVGGIRASIYNAVPRESVEALSELMLSFRKNN